MRAMPELAELFPQANVMMVSARPSHQILTTSIKVTQSSISQFAELALLFSVRHAQTIISAVLHVCQGTS